MRRMYSENQLVNVLENKDVKVKTLSQSEANEAVVFDFTALGGLKIKNTYNRFEVINNVLYVIVNVEIYNDSGSSISLTNMCEKTVELPVEIASKIYDCAGKHVGEAGSNVWITSAIGAIKETNTGTYPTSYSLKSTCELYLLNNIANNITVAIAGTQALSIPNGKSEYISARVALTLI